ncbi:acetate--CoA ligase family protein, partial [Pseudactinotalea sp.]|uniref:acetate--CoA ligase family protein n=1 Tax=Pseudactinotalea sp. TaxID=1926260 RepID=UPI003B3B418C
GTSVRMPSDKAAELLAAYGLAVWPSTRVGDVDAALAAASSIGWPVALKAADEVLRHRADLGGVRLDLSTPAELTEAFGSLRQRLASLGRHNVAIEVQRMAPSGAACVVTGIEDDLYGPILSFGLAGDAVEMLDDVAYRVPPLTEADVADLVRAVRASPRLLGYRGLPPMDVAALEDVIERLSVLKEELPEVRAVALNPVLVGEHGAAILSATVDLLAAERGDTARRALP